MDIIKRLFSFNDEENCAIGLCKFNDDFFKLTDAKEHIKKRLKKDTDITKILKRRV